MKRFGTTFVFAVVLATAIPGQAFATPRVLFESESFRLQARLTTTRLDLAHTNLTDFPLRFRCRTELEGKLYPTRLGVLPHAVLKVRLPTQSSTLRGAMATCIVNVNETFTVLWKGEFLEVFGKALTAPSGAPLRCSTSRT